MANKTKSSLNRSERTAGYLFILPQMLLFLAFVVYPVIEGFRMSFFDINYARETFVGLENYISLFHDEIFIRSVWNTLIFVVSVTILTVGAGFFIAASIFDKNPHYVSFVRACYYMPAIIGMTVLSLIWLWILNPAYGLVNYYLGRVGIPATNLLGDSATVLPVLIVMSFFYNLGQAVILFVAAMNGISMECLEAADIDGATRWQKIKSIIVPLILPTAAYLTILTIINVIKAFTIIHLMTAGGPNYASVTMMYLSYMEAFKFNHLGVGAAIGVIMFIIVWIMSMTILTLFQKKKD